MDVRLLSHTELAEELGRRVREERLRQNMTQRTLAERAQISRPTISRLESGGSTTLPHFLAVLVALGRAGDLADVLEPPPATSIDEFTRATRTRQRGRR